MSKVTSWGNYPKYDNIERKRVYWRDQTDLFSRLPVLPYGQGRSYGDSCLNDHGVVLDTSALNRLMAFDPDTGVLRCESGVTLADILALTIPQGWMPAVVPGTQFVSVGGAIANDVHGKNHHRVGSFGCHVKQFELLRSDQTLRICSATENADWFAATIGGLGLTGLITWADIQLQKIPSPFLTVETVTFYSLAEFLALSKTSESDFDYTVAWIDCQASPLRGLFMRANFTSVEQAQPLAAPPGARKKSMPFFAPNWALNHYSIGLFSQLYFYAGKRKPVQQQHYQSFFFPLDNLRHWNRIYGKRGFLQYQCVVPWSHAESALQDVLKKIAASGQGSFLSVLKTFGDIRSPGLLSFPMPGVTLALDFAHQGTKTVQLLNELDQIVMAARGRLYPAKDARMSAAMFQAGYPNDQTFKQYQDPGFGSSFWRRVCKKEIF